MKRATSLAVCLLLIFILSSCVQATQDTALVVTQQSSPVAVATQSKISTPTTKYNIALVMKTLTNPFFVEMEKGARKAEKELGINLIVKTGAQETSVEQQITIIEELIKEKIDVILIAPADSVQLIPVLKKAQDAGIKIINLDNQLDAQSMEKVGLTNVPYISVDNVKGAYL